MKNLTIDENLVLGKSSFILQDSLIFILDTEKIRNCLSSKSPYLNIENNESSQNLDVNDGDI
jgi:hypothetical protein